MVWSLLSICRNFTTITKFTHVVLVIIIIFHLTSIFVIPMYIITANTLLLYSLCSHFTYVLISTLIVLFVAFSVLNFRVFFV